MSGQSPQLPKAHLERRKSRASGAFVRTVSGFIKDRGTLKERHEMRDRLRLAILTNDRATVNEIIQDKETCPTKELNHLDQNGRSCILNAAFAYQLEICLDFLDAGADVNVCEKESGNSVLHYLAKPQEPKEDASLLTLKTILHGLLAKGCNPNQKDSEGCTPLHYAARVANVAIAGVLIQHGAVINTKNELGETALHYAVLNQQVSGWHQIVNLLIDKGANPNAIDKQARSPLAILKSHGALPLIMRELVSRMEKMKVTDIQDMPDNGSIVVNNSDANVQKRVRKVVAVGALAQQPALQMDKTSVEHVQHHGSRLPTDLDKKLISECAVGNINVEYGSSGLKVVDIDVLGIYNLYQNVFFGQTHFIFVGKISGVGCKIVCVLRMPNYEKQAYHALVINQFGMFETFIDQKLIIGEENVGGASPRDLEVKLLNHFRECWGTSAIDYTLLDSRVKTNSSFAALMSHGDKQGNKSDAHWNSVSSTKSDMPCLILGLECRLGLTKRLTVAVFLVKNHQTEEQFFENKSTSNFARLLGILGKRVPIKGWSSYSGGMISSKAHTHMYYTSWRGFEIVFHVATELNKECQRQYIGNDKVCIILAEEGAVIPQFRGNVNSVSIVLRCMAEKDGMQYGNDHMKQWGCPAELFGSATAADRPFGWRIGVFFRKRITNYRPILTTSLVRDEDLLRDLVLANAVNGHSAIMRSPPYSNTVDACFAEETERLVDRFLDFGTKKSGRRPNSEHNHK